MKSTLTNLHNHLHRSHLDPTCSVYDDQRIFKCMAEVSYHCKFFDCTLELIPLAYNCLFINKVKPSMLHNILVYPRKERKSHKFSDLVEGTTLSIGYSGSRK
ncbi:hypothetical protein BH18THE2_BH18THE2_35210 [soil metagenome]